MHAAGDVTWRPLTTDDAGGAADLLNAVDAVDRTGERYTAQDCLQELLDPHIDLPRATLGAFRGGAIVGYVKTAWRPGAHRVHRMVLDGTVHPDHRRRGIGTALLRAGTAGARAVHDQHHPGLRLVVEVLRGEHVAGAAALYRAHGFVPVRWSTEGRRLLAHDLPEAAPPVGYRVRAWSPSVDDDAARAVRNASFAARADPAGSDEDDGSLPAMTAEGWRHRMLDHTFRPDVSLLADSTPTGRPVGVLLAKHWEADVAATGVRDAQVVLVGVLPEHRGRGVGTALVAAALRAAASAGFDRVSARVSAAERSRGLGLFAAAGFTMGQRSVRWAAEA